MLTHPHVRLLITTSPYVAGDASIRLPPQLALYDFGIIAIQALNAAARLELLFSLFRSNLLVFSLVEGGCLFAVSMALFTYERSA